jgi:broad specificity phosphatase PhoE
VHAAAHGDITVLAIIYYVLNNIMEQLPKIKSPESVEYGNDVTLHVYLMRHAEKSSFAGELTDEGKKAAQEFGENRNAKSYHSDVPRNRQTAEAITASSTYNARERTGLAVSGEKTWYDEYTAMINHEGQYEETRPIQKLQFDIGRENRPEGMLSSKEISAQVAGELVHFIDMSRRLKNKSEVNIDLVSHTGIIEHILIDLLDGDPDTFLQDIGGGMRYLEGVDITINREDRDTVSVTVSVNRTVETVDGESREVNMSKTLTEEEVCELAAYTHDD